MDDSSNGTAQVPLRSLTSIPAGKSAVFSEGNATGTTDATIINAFSSAWFGISAPPVGLIYGFYGGAGVGLSTGGDAVNLLDAGGVLHANVSFGAATAAQTLHNSAGLNNTTISPLSVAGVNGAFHSDNGTETGSPEIDVDLSRYVRVGRFDLPKALSADNLMAEEASAVTYYWDTDTLFVVGDEGTTIVQVS